VPTRPVSVDVLHEVDRILRGTAPDLGFYVAVILLAIVAPHVAAFG
jgi:hypothetical protein